MSTASRLESSAIDGSAPAAIVVLFHRYGVRKLLANAIAARRL